MSDFEGGDDVEFGGGGDGDGGDFADTHQEVTDESWGSRLKSACAGICIGLLLFFGSFPLLFWNEGRAVERYDTLQEGEQITKSVSAQAVDAANDGSLVHFTAVVRSAGNENITDPIFGVTTDGGLKLRRDVEMYQWKERVKTKKVKKAGGGTTTTRTYSYYQDWDSRPISSSSFSRPEGHTNPGSMRFDSLVLAADVITAGAFVLPPDLVERISWYVPLDGVSASSIPDSNLRSEAKPYGSNGFYLGGSVSSPSVGNTRVTWDHAPPGTISIVAQQNGNKLATYEAEAGGSILLFKEGNYTLNEMYEAANYENNVLTWVLRFVGFLVMGLGIYLVLRPIEVFADVLPCVGNIVGCGIAFVAFFVAGLLSGLTISIAWLIHHPMIGGIVLAVFVAVTVGIGLCVKCIQKKVGGDANGPYGPHDGGKVGGADGKDNFQNDLELSPEAPQMQQQQPQQPMYYGTAGAGGVVGGNENQVDLSNDNIPTTQGYAIPTTQGYVVDSSPSGPAPIPVTQGYVVSDPPSYPSGK